MTRERSSRRPELLIPLKSDAGTLRHQIGCAIREATQAGRLTAGTVLPSTRVLSRDLGVSRGVVVNAYEQLALQKDSPEPRPIQPPEAGGIIAIPVLGGLHHRYERRAG